MDVFFVISGYLITGGILRDLKADRFSISNFYYRRIRRIMPAYFAMIAGVFVVGCVLYYSHPLIRLADSVTAGTLFVANLHFWMLGGDYFAPNLHSQPLLHLWSLSVEEQFYLFIPLLLAVTWKIRRSLVAPVLALLAVLSLSGAIYVVLHSKQNNAFYFLHFRAWELLAGSLLAMIPSSWQVFNSTGSDSRCRKQTLTSHSVLATLGLLMVGLTYIFISSTTPFPGLAAVPPVVGTALLIRYGQRGWVSRLLSTRLFVIIGKISYSLYLWHWPVTVFWKYAVYDQLYYYDYLGMFMLSLVLAYISWKFVELPVRTSKAWSMRCSFAFATLGVILLVTIGTVSVSFKGYRTILHPKANELVCEPIQYPILENLFFSVMKRVFSFTGCNSVWFQKIIHERQTTHLLWGGDGSSSIGVDGEPTFLLIGDSHAGALRYGMDMVFREKNISGYAITYSATDMFNLSQPKAQGALQVLTKMQHAKTVIIVEMWARSFSSQPKDVVYAQLEEYCKLLRSRNKIVILVSDIPFSNVDFLAIEARKKIIEPRQKFACSFQQSEVEYDQVQGEFNLGLKNICNKTGALFIPLNLALKRGQNYDFCDVQDGKIIQLYKDASHLSQDGSLYAAKFIMPYILSNVTFVNPSQVEKTGIRNSCSAR